MNLIRNIKEKIEILRTTRLNLRSRVSRRKLPVSILLFTITMIIPPIIPAIFITLYRLTKELWKPDGCIKIKIKDIDCHYSNYSTIKELLKDRNEENVVDYKWDVLIESIKKYKNLLPLVVQKSEDRYTILDGNHRYIVLKDIYGEEYEVNVKIKNEYEA